MRKWEAVSAILGLLGLGVMAGQGFEFNGWVLLFWGAAVVVGIIAYLHRESNTDAAGTLGDINPAPSPPPTKNRPRLRIRDEAVEILAESAAESVRAEYTLREADRIKKKLVHGPKSDD